MLFHILSTSYPQNRYTKTKGRGCKLNTITIEEIARLIGKEPETRTLPNGRVISGLHWKGEDLVSIARVLHNRSQQFGPVVDLDGPAPGWLVTAIVHELHPRAVRVNSPDGFVAIGCQKPSGSGTGPNLEFQVTEGPDGWLVVEARAIDPSVPFSPCDLDAVVPPGVPFGSKVILSGRLPNWMLASLAMAYHGLAKAVACFQPGVGATVAITHSQDVRLGEVIPLE